MSVNERTAVSVIDTAGGEAMSVVDILYEMQVLSKVSCVV